jgi:hypothetical protein
MKEKLQISTREARACIYRPDDMKDVHLLLARRTMQIREFLD